MKDKRVHIIGICGVATGALAVAFHQSGAKVSGSDKGFFPPVSTELERAGISFYAGWHPEKMISKEYGGVPEIVIVGTASGRENPETLWAKEHNIPMYSFAEAIGQFLVREKSVVCSGTWGKTSSSALLSYILDKSGKNPAYMFGGVSLSHPASAKFSSSNISVCEGDEYKSGPNDPTAKFFYYKPTHLLLTAVSWDHADLYPTEESYFKVFEKLTEEVSVIVACGDNDGVKKSVGNKKAVWYGRSGFEYNYSDVRESADGIDFKINGVDIHSPMIGAFQAENITGCFAMARELGVNENDIVKGIASFQGLKRRLERRLDGRNTEKGITIIDDIAHSPEKAVSVISTLKEVYGKDGRIIVVFEPNIGGRRIESSGKYDSAFKDADMVIVPRLTVLKKSPDAISESFDGSYLKEVIAKTHNNTVYIEEDKDLVKRLVEDTKKGDVIAFLGSHGFRGMIEETVEALK
jgi:UDP-N-acetylmuramate: L-alanyl-gamma-D-glutamyl-meso-diaminopimelate ligase